MTHNDETITLLRYLDAQRESVLAILDGLDQAALTTPAVPSGWTPLGLVAHLCGAEFVWLHHVLTGATGFRPPWPPGGSYSPFVVDHPADEVIAFYRGLCAISNRNIAAADLDAPPAGPAPSPDLAEYAVDVRSVVLHMVEETARHAGHLDVVRELVDGTTGLGPR